MKNRYINSKEGYGMGITLNIDLDEFEKWLTPERVEIAFYNAGYEVELKDEFKKMNENEIKKSN